MLRLPSLIVITAGAALLAACQTPSTGTSPPASTATPATPVEMGPARVGSATSPGCPGSNQGPAFIIGARDLATASQSIPGGSRSPASITLGVPSSGDLTLGSRFSSGDIGAAFQMCVITNPPARGAALAGIVSGQLQASIGMTDAEQAFWQSFFDTYFIRPLQLTPTDATGVLRIDVLAGNLQAALASAPSGSGQMLITVTLPDGAHQLSLAVERR
jgi:hypothetical protein